MGTLTLNDKQLHIIQIAVALTFYQEAKVAGIQEDGPVVYLDNWTSLNFVSPYQIVQTKRNIQIQKKIKWLQIEE
jgi:hypothetical protein